MRGLENSLRGLGMLPGDVGPAPAGAQLVRRFVWLRAASEGWWEPRARPGDRVSAGGELGVLRDLHGEPFETILSPEDGVILFVTSSPAVAVDGILIAVGAGIEPAQA